MAGGRSSDDNVPSPDPNVGASGNVHELFRTMDGRHIIERTAELGVRVERLISDVKDQGDKLEQIRHQLSLLATLPDLVKDQSGKLELIRQQTSPLSTLPELVSKQGEQLSKVSHRVAWLMGIGAGLGAVLLGAQVLILVAQHISFH